MTIPTEIAVLFMGAMLSLQAWTLLSIIDLKERIARLESTQ